MLAAGEQSITSQQFNSTSLKTSFLICLPNNVYLHYFNIQNCLLKLELSAYDIEIVLDGLDFIIFCILLKLAICIYKTVFLSTHRLVATVSKCSCNLCFVHVCEESYSSFRTICRLRASNGSGSSVKLDKISLPNHSHACLSPRNE